MDLNKLLSAWITVVLGLAISGSVSATTLFQDNFDTDSAASVLNFNALINWTVSDGTIDYIRSGGFGINCVGNTGGCLDMDGSQSNAGRITSKTLFSFLGGVTYTLSAQVSGNQRGGAADSVSFGLDDGTTTSSTGLIAFNTPFAPFSVVFTPASNINAHLFFEGIGSDNVGAILDNVALTDNQNGGGGTVPEPGALLLAGLALVSAALIRRRKSYAIPTKLK